MKVLILLMLFSVQVTAQDIDLDSLDDLENLELLEAELRSTEGTPQFSEENSFEGLEETTADELADIPTPEEEDETLESIDDLEDLEISEVESKTKAGTKKLGKQEVDFSVVNSLSDLQRKNIDQIIEARTRLSSQQKRFSLQQIESLKVQLSDIAKTPKRTIFIPRGTALVQLKTGRFFNTPRGFYAEAHTLTDASLRRYITNNKGEIVYSVSGAKVADIERIIEMHRKPHQFTRLKKPKEKPPKQEFDYSLNFNLHLGINVPDYTEKLIGDTSTASSAVSFEGAWLSKLNFDIQAGLTSMYEVVTGTKGATGSYNITSFSVGPIFKSSRFWENYRLLLEGRLSLFSQVDIIENSSNTRYALAENSLLIGLEKEVSLKKFGYLNYGVNFQRKWLNASASENTATNVNPRTRFDDTFSFYFGHRSDWIW